MAFLIPNAEAFMDDLEDPSAVTDDTMTDTTPDTAPGPTIDLPSSPAFPIPSPSASPPSFWDRSTWDPNSLGAMLKGQPVAPYRTQGQVQTDAWDALVTGPSHPGWSEPTTRRTIDDITTSMAQNRMPDGPFADSLRQLAAQPDASPSLQAWAASDAAVRAGQHPFQPLWDMNATAQAPGQNPVSGNTTGNADDGNVDSQSSSQPASGSSANNAENGGVGTDCSAPPTAASADDTKAASSQTGPYAWPVPGNGTPAVRVALGPNGLRYADGSFSPDGSTRNGRPHYGIDLPATVGDPVGAVGDGTVYARGFAKGWGNYIAVRHNDGFISVYAHLDSSEPLAVGTPVNQGQVVGQVGQTGNARGQGTHLHLEVRRDVGAHSLGLIRNGALAVDPTQWIMGNVH